MSSIFSGEFYQTFKSEAYSKSQCLMHEHSIAGLFYSMLANLGYQCNDPNRRVWTNKEKTVVVCLSDSFATSGTIKFKPTDQCFESNTIVITDNYINFNPQYTVLRLPDSYFGIFNYVPAPLEYAPAKRFGFSVNRLDQQRELILLELIKQSGGVETWLQLDHANFNCIDFNSTNHSVEDIQANFVKFYTGLNRIDPEYDNIVQQIIQYLPIRTHQMSIEQAHASVFLNLVVESYTNDDVIALSEKTFRALVTPAPWALFSCVGTVDRLSNLGFDVLSDIVDHRYNHVRRHNLPISINKIQTYITNSIEIYKKLAVMDPQQLKIRCEKAANHNQQLLSTLQRQWPQDFANWLPTAIDKIAGK